MPRNASGTYTLPSGNPVVSGNIIEANWANSTLSDVATELTNSLSRTGAGGMTGALRLADGTASVPGLSWDSETTTGFYRAAASDVRFVVATNLLQKWTASGTEVTGNLSYTGTLTGGTGVVNIGSGQFYKDGSGNIGIGTATPSAKLDVVGTAAISGNLTLSGGTANGVLYLNGSKVATSGSALTFDGTNFATTGTVTATKLVPTGNVVAGNGMYLPAANTLAWSTNGAEGMRLDASGNLGIGAISPSTYGKFVVEGTGSFTSALVSTSATTTQRPMLEFKKTAAIGSGVTSTIGRISFNGNFKSVQEEGAYINVTSNNQGNILLNTTLLMAVYEPAVDVNAAYLQLGVSSGATLYTNQTANIQSDLALTLLSGTDIKFEGDPLLVGELGRFTQDREFVLGNGLTAATPASSTIMATGGSGTNKTGGTLTIQGGRGTGSGAGGPIVFKTSAAGASGTTLRTADERARITSGGEFYVGSTSAVGGAADRLQIDAPSLARAGVFRNPSSGVDTVAAWNSDTSGDNKFVQFYTEAGATVRGLIDYNRAGGLTRYNTTSDYRAKDIIGPLQNVGATIDALKVYEGVMKGATQSRPMLIAHEAQEHAPYAVSGVKDELNEDGSPKFQQIDVSSLVPLLLAEIQSLRARVAALEAAP